MKPIVTPEEMAACDRAAIEAGTPQEVLMDRAGCAVAMAAIRIRKPVRRAMWKL